MKDDLPRLEAYLRKVFGSQAIRIVMNPKKSDMAEVFVGEEFIAPIYRDEDDGEISYQLQMAILDVDLEDA
jgi:hypothetical protein